MALKGTRGRHVGFGLRMLKQFAKKPEHAERIKKIYTEYLPAILTRYDQQVIVNGEEVETPIEGQGKNRIQNIFDRRLKDVLGQTV